MIFTFSLGNIITVGIFIVGGIVIPMFLRNQNLLFKRIDEKLETIVEAYKTHVAKNEKDHNEFFDVKNKVIAMATVQEHCKVCQGLIPAIRKYQESSNDHI